MESGRCLHTNIHIGIYTSTASEHHPRLNASQMSSVWSHHQWSLFSLTETSKVLIYVDFKTIKTQQLISDVSDVCFQSMIHDKHRRGRLWSYHVSDRVGFPVRERIWVTDDTKTPVARPCCLLQAEEGHGGQSWIWLLLLLL